MEQFLEWKAFDKLHPIDSSFRLEVGFARICYVVHSLATTIHSKGHKDSSKITDHLPQWGEPVTPPQQSVEGIKKALLSFAKKHNDKLREKRRQ